MPAQHMPGLTPQLALRIGPERWLTPAGLLAPDVEFADPARLALPAEWYTPADLAALGGGGGGRRSADAAVPGAAAAPGPPAL